MSKQYSLISVCKYDREDVVVLMTGELPLILPRFKMFYKYNKHFTCCPKTKNVRKLHQNIEKKLFKELHKQFENSWLFDLMYNRHICILDEQAQQILSPFRFRYVLSGIVPNDYESNVKYLEESKQIKALMSNPWQDLSKRYSFEYFNYV